MTDAEDRECIRRYLGGDADALETLVTRYRRPLFGFIVNMTRNPTEADDVFQETWCRVIRKIAMYHEDNFCGWLVRIAHNLVIDRYRRVRPTVSLDAQPEDGRGLLETLPGRETDPAATVQDGDLGRRIAAAVAGLPPEQKEVFLMRTTADLPFREIARIQAVSINTALARMQYALQKLRTVLKGEYAALAGG